jgi:hypothetical protein
VELEAKTVVQLLGHRSCATQGAVITVSGTRLVALFYAKLPCKKDAVKDGRSLVEPG